MSLRKFYLYLLRAPLGPRNVLDCFWEVGARLASKCGMLRLEVFLLRRGLENAARAALLYGVSPSEYVEARRRPGPLSGEPLDESPGEPPLAHPDVDELFLRVTSDTPVTVTVPRYASGGFKVGGAINLQQGGPGPSVVVPEDDTVSLSSSTTPKI